MKTKLVRSLLTLFVFGLVSSLPAAIKPAASPGTRAEIGIDSVAAKIKANGSTVTPGTSRIMVSARLGMPSAVLPDGSWLYRGFNARRGDGQLTGSGTLVVRFDASTVTSLSLADAATVLAWHQKTPDKNQLIATADLR